MKLEELEKRLKKESPTNSSGGESYLIFYLERFIMILTKYTTLMWKYDKEFRFQTNCKEIYQGLKGRNRFWLVGWALNADLWIFQASFPTTQKALYVLNNLTYETAVLREDCLVIEHCGTLGRRNNKTTSTGRCTPDFYHIEHEKSVPEVHNEKS